MLQTHKHTQVNTLQNTRYVVQHNTHKTTPQIQHANLDGVGEGHSHLTQGDVGQRITQHMHHSKGQYRFQLCVFRWVGWVCMTTWV